MLFPRPRRSPSPESDVTKGQPRIGVQAIRPLIVGLQQHRVDLVRFFAEFGLEAGDLSLADARLPLELLDRIWERAAQCTGDDQFGLHAAERVGTESFGVLSYLGVTSASIGDGLSRVCRYFRILSDASSYNLEIREPMVTLTATQDVAQCGPVRHRVEFTIATIYLYAKRSAAGRWSASEVFFEHPEPADTSEHIRLFECPLCFSAGMSGFRFPSDLLSSPLKAADTNLAGHLECFARQMLDGVPKPTRVAQAVREQLLAAGAGVDLTLDHIARRVGMSTRTLQRRLAEEGTSHQRVLDETRQAVAISMLARPGMGVAEVAFALGFSEPAAFHHAFKRWTGKTPAAYRRTFGDLDQDRSLKQH